MKHKSTTSIHGIFPPWSDAVRTVLSRSAIPHPYRYDSRREAALPSVWTRSRLPAGSAFRIMNDNRQDGDRAILSPPISGPSTKSWHPCHLASEPAYRCVPILTGVFLPVWVRRASAGPRHHLSLYSCSLQSASSDFDIDSPIRRQTTDQFGGSTPALALIRLRDRG
jgi:hypothetical protein